MANCPAVLLGALRVAASAGLLCAGCAEPPATRIVLISIDTLRHDGLAADIMPRTHAWSQRGLVFDRHHSATSTTQPTHASLFTGLHPWEHAVTRNGGILPPHADTLAERLQRAGYSTHAVIASFPLHADFGLAQGFETWVDDFDEMASVGSWAGHAIEGGGFSTSSHRVAETANALLDGARGDRQLFFFHFFDAHAPYGDAAGAEEWLTDELVLQRIAAGEPDPSALIARARRAYDRDLRVLDAELGRLLDRLMSESGFETHVVVVSDHGESFGEDGSMGHGKRLTEAQLRVPLFVLSPNATPGVRTEPVGSVDVAATLLGLAGIQATHLSGVDLLDARLPGGHSVVGMRRTFLNPYFERRVDGTIRVVTGLRFYAVEGDRLWTGDANRVTLADDPASEVDADRAEAWRQRFGRLERRLQRVVANETSDDPSESARRALEALGYLR